MACLLQVHGWSTCLDNIQWSELNDIAIGLGSKVEILIPRLSFIHQKDEKQDKSEPWHQVTVQTSLFTEAEWSTKEPLPSYGFSIGEEQSYSHVAALSWSPAGLARHQRCALAVLTSNHVLSVWQSNSDPRDKKSWERVLIINHALVNPSKLDTTGSDVDLDARLAWRIRSFAWGPVVRCLEIIKTRSGCDTTLTVDRFLLSVTNDLGELVLLEVRSPHQASVEQGRQWTCHAVSRSTVSASKHAYHKVGNITGDIFRKGTFASNLAWCKWKSFPGAAEGGTLSSVLAYNIGRELYVRLVLMTSGVNLSITSPFTLRVSGEHEGPVKLIPDVGDTSIYLLSFDKANVQVTELKQTITGHFDMNTNTYGRSGGWAPVVGVAKTCGQQASTVIVHYSPQLSSGVSESTKPILLPFGQQNIPSQGKWIQTFTDEKAGFNVEHQLGQRVVARSAGLASSCTGYHIAVCFALHPSELVEYVIETQQISSIIISDEHTNMTSVGAQDALGSTPLKDAPFESILFTLAKHSPLLTRLDDGVTPALDAFFNDLRGRREHLGVSLENTRGNLDALVHRIKKGLTIADSFVNHLTLVPNVHDQTFRQQLLDVHDSISLRLASTVLSLIRYSNVLMPSKAEQHIANIFAKISLEQLVDQGPVDGSNGHRDGHNLLQSPFQVEEHCSICQAPIPFDSHRLSSCKIGHQFVRCSATFLSIQKPGITKYCGLCQRHYLTESFLFGPNVDKNFVVTSRPTEDVHMSDDDTQSKQSICLLEVLVTVCDACLYCGGRFIG